MVEQMGNNAGILWNMLNAQGVKTEVAKLKKESSLSETDFWAAIGWLAREDKLDITTEKKGKKQICFITLK